MTLLDTPTIHSATRIGGHQARLAADVLEKAIKLVDNDWCQRASHVDRYVNGRLVSTGYCIVGAAVRAAAELHAGYGSTHFALTILREVVGRDIAIYNDNPERLKSEVVDKMGEALELARSRS
jgi:hypothetical protein